jgi:hypothetical protein
MNCRFTNNVANEEGAAFHVDVSCNNVIISNSNFTNNKARQVAALTILAQTTVSNCSFINNTAYRAPAIWGERGPFTLINCSQSGTNSGYIISTKKVGVTKNVIKEKKSPAHIIRKIP